MINKYCVKRTPLICFFIFMGLLGNFARADWVKRENAVQLDGENINGILASNELVVIMFHAVWCGYSQLFLISFDLASSVVADMYREQPGRVVMGQVDCVSQPDLRSRFHIGKYPTVRVFNYGRPAKKEYRGERTWQALVIFVQSELRNPVQEVSSWAHTVVSAQDNGRAFIRYVQNKDSENYRVYKKVATHLKGECKFFAVVLGDSKSPQSVYEQQKLIGKSAGQGENWTKIFFLPGLDTPVIEYPGDPSDYDALNVWATANCESLVRELTFENAEEITEENRPCLTLFYDPKDQTAVRLFKDIVARIQLHQEHSINFLVADGFKFAHVTYALRKKQSDLPIIVIDNFKNMYPLPDDADFSEPGRLQQFVDDLYSGKLHRDTYGYTPDTSVVPTDLTDDNLMACNYRSAVNVLRRQVHHPLPLESTLKKLAPSVRRYTLLKSEL